MEMMMTIDKKDELLMRLVHYFVTEQNYTPMIVNGVKDEVWLQNQEGPYKIIRINSNYIHNNEQINYDLAKINNVMRQVKKKTVSLTMNTLNILLDVNEDVLLPKFKNINCVILKNVKDVSKKAIVKKFPDIQKKLLLDRYGIDLILNVTEDLNRKTIRDNELYEKTFKEKKTFFTNALIAINIVIFMIVYFLSGTNLSGGALLKFGAVYAPLIKAGEVWRLVTGAFLHAGILHLLVNMYSLYLIGTQVEMYIGKYKFLGIYFISAISGTLMSCLFHPNTISIGASGAIFGLLGSLVYFGYHYRLYLGSVLKNQIIPIIICNLALGFLMSGIDNAAHIGGLIGGYMATTFLGVTGKSSMREKVNGGIALLLYLAFMVVMLFK